MLLQRTTVFRELPADLSLVDGACACVRGSLVLLFDSCFWCIVVGLCCFAVVAAAVGLFWSGGLGGGGGGGEQRGLEGLPADLSLVDGACVRGFLAFLY